MIPHFNCSSLACAHVSIAGPLLARPELQLCTGQAANKKTTLAHQAVKGALALVEACEPLSTRRAQADEGVMLPHELKLFHGLASMNIWLSLYPMCACCSVWANAGVVELAW